jgi:hypothetical protein
MELPSLDTPGRELSGEDATVVVESTGVAVGSTGTTTLGDVGGDRTTLYAVVVNPTDADFNFQINTDGDTAFTSAQSPGGTNEETFVPDGTAAVVYGASDSTVEFEVTSASSNGSATADVTVHAIEEESY